MELGISGGIGLLFGVVLAWLALRSRTAATQVRLSLMDKELAAAKADLARLLQEQRSLLESRARMESALESERKTNNEKIELLTKAGDRAATDLQNAFKALAADALKSNNSSFLQIAQETLKRFQSEAKGDLDARQKAVADLVTPVRESLSKVDAQIQQMEIARGEAYGDLRAQVQSLITTQKELQSETGNLVRALRTPNVRGRWGEIQLRRVVEIAGMLSYCDFAEQETVTSESGRLRPDLVVKLPGGKNVVVDAKTPLQAFLDAFETTDEETRRVLPGQSRAAGPRPHEDAEREELLGAIRGHAGICGDVSAGRNFFQRRAGAGSRAHRARRSAARDSGVADHADRAVEGRRLRMEPGKAGAQRATDQRAWQRTPRSAAETGGAHHRSRR